MSYQPLTAEDRAKMVFELNDLAHKDDDVKSMIAIVCRQEGVGLGHLPEEALNLLYDAAIDMVDELGPDEL